MKEDNDNATPNPPKTAHEYLQEREKAINSVVTKYLNQIDLSKRSDKNQDTTNEFKKPELSDEFDAQEYRECIKKLEQQRDADLGIITLDKNVIKIRDARTRNEETADVATGFMMQYLNTVCAAVEILDNLSLM